MAREAYTKQLTHLQDLVLEMGSMVDRAVDRSMTALLDRDADLARTVVEGDKVVNSKNFECQNEVISLITQQAPMARDLRLVVSVAAIMTDLERMGDHAEGIARIVIMMQDEPLVKPLIDIPVMAGHAREMLRDSIQAFVDRARSHGLEQLVLLSGRGEPEAQACERIVRESGLEWTVVRASWFFQNFSEGAFAEMVLQGRITLPAGPIPEPFVDVDDIAEVAIKARSSKE